MVAGSLRFLKSFIDLMGESNGTNIACIKFTLIIAIDLTGTPLSNNDVNGKLPPLPN